jgi:ZIP family zinc transporter/zinc and cadmium transporter
MTAIAYALIAAAANVVGAAAVTSRRAWSTRTLELLIALAAGFMLSVSLADLIPDAILRDGETGAVLVLAGFLLVHLTQHALVGHFHFGEETHVVSSRVSASALAGLLLHTFGDGVAIASGFLVSPELGVLVFSAIFLHKLPEGLAISSLVLAAGGSRGRALAAAALLGVATIAGVVLTGSFGPLAHYGLALSGGITLYVGASNLVPEFQGKAGWWHSLVFFGGVGIYFLVRAVLT